MQKTTNPTESEVPSNKHQHNTSDIKEANLDDSFQDDINLNSNDKQYLSTTSLRYKKTHYNSQLNHMSVKDWPDDNLTELQKYAKFSITTYNNRMHSPKGVRVPPSSKKTNGIPSSIVERLHFISKLIKNERFEKYFKERPPRKTSTLKAITDYITSYYGPKGDIETFVMIFYYICHEITYDVNGEANGHNNSYHQSAEAVIRNGVALDEGFSNLFEHFCNSRRLRIKKLYGNCLLFPKKKFKGNNNNNMLNTKEHLMRLRISNSVETRSSTAKPKNPIPRRETSNHIWNAIFFKNEWYPCDLVLGSGGIVEKNPNENISYFNPYYFITPPEFMIMSHRPEEDEWQLTSKTITEMQFVTKKFIDYGKFYQQVYEHDINLLTHEHPVITHSMPLTPLEIKLQIKDIVLQCDLYQSNGKDKIQEVKFQQDEDEDLFTLEPQFPTNNGIYIIRVLGRSPTSTDLIYYQLLDYRVRVGVVSQFTHFEKYKIKKSEEKEKLLRNTLSSLPIATSGNAVINNKHKKHFEIGTRTITDYGKVFPSKTTRRICFDNEGAYIYEPKSVLLKKGTEVTFRVRVKGAIAVAVLDGRKWTYLHKMDDNIYTGTTVINSENVSLCSLKACNVYTEVFRFRVKNTLRDRRSLLP